MQCEGYIFRMCVERNDYRRLFISDRAVELWILKTWQQRPIYALLQKRGPKSYSDQPWNTIVKTCAQKSALANICSGKYLFWLQQWAANAVCGKRAKVGGGTMGTFSSLSICQTVQIENHPEDNSTQAWEADANYRGPCRLVLRACAGLQGLEWRRIDGKMVLIRRSESALALLESLSSEVHIGVVGLWVVRRSRGDQRGIYRGTRVVEETWAGLCKVRSAGWLGGLSEGQLASHPSVWVQF